MHTLNNTMIKMKKSLTLLAISSLLLSLTACQKQLGGGGRSLAGKDLAFGMSAGKKLGFVIFTDITGGATSGGSSWTGSIKPKEGTAVEYEGNSESITINGGGFKFSNGRVFLVETKGGGVAVSQLNIPMGDATYDAEIDRISELDEVKEFLSK